MCVGIENYYKFPELLRNKLLNNEIKLPKDTRFKYSSIIGYRCIQRSKDDNTPLNQNDMKSYAELKKRRPGQSIEDLKTNPKYYGVSLYKNINEVKQVLKLPKPNKKIAKGYISMEGGPELTEGEHVCWWLYENVSLSTFKICEE